MNYSDKPVFQGKKVALLSLGCKVNSYETDSIRRQFEEAGARIVDFDDACRGTDGGADIFVINTCSVTNIADRKSRQMLRRARQNNPGAIVAATGCYAQIGAQELIDNGVADIVAGNSHKSGLIDMVASRIAGSAGKADTGDTGTCKIAHARERAGRGARACGKGL